MSVYCWTLWPVMPRCLCAGMRWKSPGQGFANRMLSITGPVQSRAEMVARQLPDLAHDRLFEESMALARTMAEAML
jgi:hypothetical protein